MANQISVEELLLLGELFGLLSFGSHALCRVYDIYDADLCDIYDAHCVHIGRAQYKLLDAPVLI